MTKKRLKGNLCQQNGYEETCKRLTQALINYDIIREDANQRVQQAKQKGYPLP